MATPRLIYAPIAGRAELIRLIAAAGGVDITEDSDLKYFGKPTLEGGTGENKTDYVSATGMPLLQHGDLKMSQSFAIETYIASIAPKYADLTPQQRAVDNMYQGIKEEMLSNCAKAVFTTRKTDEAQAKKDVIALFDKWFAIFEEKVPESEFLQGLSIPTPADLALVNITNGYMPFGAAAKMAEYDFGKWPKVKALCERAAADSGVAAYLSKSQYTKANPFNM